MALNISDAESSFAYGVTEWNDFIEQFEAAWYLPLAVDLLRQIMGGVMEDANAGVVDPDTAIKVAEMMEKLRGV